MTLNLQTSTSTQNGTSPSEPNDWKDLRTLWVIHMEAHHADLTEHDLRAQAWSRLRQLYICCKDQAVWTTSCHGNTLLCCRIIWIHTRGWWGWPCPLWWD